jgi:glycosyltransferase involved in cell wall biosynthesis
MTTETSGATVMADFRHTATDKANDARSRAAPALVLASCRIESATHLALRCMSRTGPSPKFTILTATYNAAGALGATARSLRMQTYRDFEWIVIDGASRDDTRQRVASFGDLVTTFVCEPDTGIFNALNKGLSLLRGQWLLILGAGDCLFDPDVLGRVSAFVDDLPPGVTTAYGSVVVYDLATGGARRTLDRPWEGLDGPWGGGRPKHPCHQGVFQRSALFADGAFRFDERCRITADTEVILRELMAGRSRKMDLTVALFEDTGTSERPENRLRLVAESVYITWKLGIFRRWLYQLAALAWSAAFHLGRKLAAAVCRLQDR